MTKQEPKQRRIHWHIGLFFKASKKRTFNWLIHFVYQKSRHLEIRYVFSSAKFRGKFIFLLCRRLNLFRGIFLVHQSTCLLCLSARIFFFLRYFLMCPYLFNIFTFSEYKVLSGTEQRIRYALLIWILDLSYSSWIIRKNIMLFP